MGGSPVLLLLMGREKDQGQERSQEKVEINTVYFTSCPDDICVCQIPFSVSLLLLYAYKERGGQLKEGLLDSVPHVHTVFTQRSQCVVIRDEGSPLGKAEGRRRNRNFGGVNNGHAAPAKIINPLVHINSYR